MRRTRCPRKELDFQSQVQNTSSYSFGASGFPTPYNVPPPNGANHYKQQMNTTPPVLGGYTFAAGGFPVPFGVQTPNVNSRYYQHQINPTTLGRYPFVASGFSAPFDGPLSNANSQYF